EIGVEEIVHRAGRIPSVRKEVDLRTVGRGIDEGPGTRVAADLADQAHVEVLVASRYLQAAPIEIEQGPFARRPGEDGRAAGVDEDHREGDVKAGHGEMKTAGRSAAGAHDGRHREDYERRDVRKVHAKGVREL